MKQISGRKIILKQVIKQICDKILYMAILIEIRNVKKVNFSSKSQTLKMFIAFFIELQNYNNTNIKLAQLCILKTN